jgi:hypothetical protein
MSFDDVYFVYSSIYGILFLTISISMVFGTELGFMECDEIMMMVMMTEVSSF